jgi:hypothetical protein
VSSDRLRNISHFTTSMSFFRARFCIDYT